MSAMGKRIELIAVGDEVLRGEFIENNTSFLSRELAKVGSPPWRITTLGDSKEVLSREISEAVGRSDVVIVTGGLGPTVDDVTKDAVIDTLHCKTEWREEIAEEIEGRFSAVGRSMPDSYRDQARVPEGAKVLPNRVGLAVGLRIDGPDFVLFLLPGVPAEMKQIFLESVLPDVPADTSKKRVRVRTFGLTETELEERVGGAVKGLEDVSIISSPRGIDLYIPRRDYEGGLKDEIEKALRSYIYTVGNDTLQEIVVERLISSGKTLASAESLTGGLAASLIVSVPGASNSFLEGFITYSNEAKERELGVKKESLEKFGAVSETVCREMADGVRRRAGTDLALSTTGIAGPTGGTKEKPVGLCYVGLAYDSGTCCRRFVFPGDRSMVRELAAHHAIDMLRLYLFGFHDRLNSYKDG